MSILDQWEAESKADLGFEDKSFDWFYIQEQSRKLIALIDLVRKKDKSLIQAVRSEAWNKFAGNSDPIMEALDETLALTEELK